MRFNLTINGEYVEVGTQLDTSDATSKDLTDFLEDNFGGGWEVEQWDEHSAVCEAHDGRIAVFEWRE